MNVAAGTTMLRNARLWPASETVDLLINEGRIASIVLAGSGRSEAGIEIIDLDGRPTIPGLWDHHVHFDQWAQVSRRLELAGAGSAAEVASTVRAHLAATADLDIPLVGYGFRDALWPDEPTKELLDKATGERAAVMVSGDLHSAWLNSAALRRYGHADHPTGLLQERDAMQVVAELSQLPDRTADAWAADAARAAAGRGVVGIIDLESPWSLDAWRRRMSADPTGNCLRVHSGVWPARLDDAIGRRLKTGDVIANSGGLLQMGPLKVITDGSLNTRTAYCHDPYDALVGRPDQYGLLVVGPEELRSLMRRATDVGLQCAIHAIGDHANSLALQAFQETGARGSIEHAQLLDDSDVARFGELDVVASVQPEHAMDDRDVADRHWAGRTGRAFVLRSLLDHGARLTFGSDAPVAPLDPWQAIAAAVYRYRGERPAWHPEQRIGLVEALAASTAHGAMRLSVGAGADLVVLDDDPATAQEQQLRRLPVSATMLGGRWTYRAGI